MCSGHRHGPPGLRRVSSILTRRVSAWQAVVLVGIAHYILRNFGKLMGLGCPEPLANLYEPAYFRATWATTALDAGFWTAMPIRRTWLRHTSSILFTLYYLINAEQADEKVRAVRSVVTVDHLRNSWNKTILNPILALSTRLLRPRSIRYKPREIRIPRPSGSRYTDSIHAWLYYDGPVSSLKRQNKLILNVPGGGYVAMTPRAHDDSLIAWAAKTGLPILSLNYGKAPEHAYPYALHECFDVYKQIILSRGRCAGLFSDVIPQIILSGDSAGGSLATGLTLLILETNMPRKHRIPATRAGTASVLEGVRTLPVPIGIILMYPCLDVNIGNWMTDEQMALIRDKDSRNTNQRVLRRKRSLYRRTAVTPYASHHELHSDADNGSPHPTFTLTQDPSTTGKQKFKTPIAVPSMITYFSDRMLTPEMMRAMIILYIGENEKPDFDSDYYLSPVLAPDHLLEHFPRCYFLTGERDPLVDDTCVMAGRIRQAKRKAGKPEDVTVELIAGVSHGFIQMAALYPKAWEFIDLIANWYDELFIAADAAALERLRLAHLERKHSRTFSPSLEAALTAHDEAMLQPSSNTTLQRLRSGHHKRTPTAGTATSEDSDAGLEMALKPLTSSKLNNRSSPPMPLLERRFSGSSGKTPSPIRTDGEVDTASSTDEDPAMTSPLARTHPIKRGSAWDLKRRSVVSATAVGAEEDESEGER